jgi:Lrp/AsnC family transcriptional regulator, leucine-responsive regulatory protein
MLSSHLDAALEPAISSEAPAHLMDAIDRRILQLLQEDASRPLKALAAEVDLSQSSVRERIARLRARGIIRRFTVELGPSAISAIVMVRLVRTPSPVIVRRIVGMPEVVRCFSLSGAIDLLVEVAGASVADINRVRDLIAGEPGVADVETSFVLNQDKAPA